jgi:hypothetical protein
MKAKDPDIRAMENPEGRLETALIEEFLRARGVDPAALHASPEVEVRRVC